MDVKKYILNRVKKGEKLHFTLIDPAEQKPEKASLVVRKAEMFGTDAVLVGGSYKVRQEKLDSTVKMIKKTVKIPVILFPSSVAYISKYADAILFLSLLNSEDTKYIVDEPARGAPIIKKLKIQPISTAYLVFKPGQRVGKKGKAKLIREKDKERSVGLSLFAEFVGFDFLYLEAGSGATKTVPTSIIREIRKEIDIPIIVGGGIKTSELAKEKIESGADIIVTGNIIEKNPDLLKYIISEIKKHK